MANYNVDIAVALKGAEKLGRFNKQIQDFAANVKGANIFLESFSKGSEGLVRNISNLQKNLGGASNNLRNVALGTKEATIAAAQFLKAQDEVNKGLAEQQKLLDDVSGRTAQRTAQDNNKLQAGLLRLERQSNKELEEKFQTRQKFQSEFKSELNDINQQRQQENKLLKDNVEKTKQSVAAEIKKKFSIVASAKQRRADLIQANRQVQTEIKINKILEARRRTQAAGSGARTRANIASSAIIGGAFPLLFGQTGAAAVGGGIGGAAGGALGGQFGFALSILGTAIGSTIDKVDKFNISVAQLNGQLNSLGFESSFSAKEINNIGKALKITGEEALGVAANLARFGKERAQILATTIGGDTGGLFAIANVKDQATALRAIEAISKNITFEKQAELIASLQNNTASQIQLKLQEILLEAKFEERKAVIEEIGIRERLLDIFKRTALIRLGLFNKLKTLESPNERVERELEELEEQFAKLKTIFDGVVGSIQSVQTETDNLQFSTTGAIENIEKELKRLQNPMFQIIELSRTIGDSFAESFKGVIKGTMTVGDAFRNMFSRIADHFLDMAARMMAAQLQKGFLGLFGNLFGGFGGGLASSAQLGAQATAMTGIPSGAALPAGSFNITGALANGGTAQRGKSYLVGERGAEIFTPGVTGTVSPNSAMGGMNIVVNVDASGSNVEGDEEEGRALGIALSAAIETELIKQKRPGGLLA